MRVCHLGRICCSLFAQTQDRGVLTSCFSTLPSEVNQCSSSLVTTHARFVSSVFPACVHKYGRMSMYLGFFAIPKIQATTSHAFCLPRSINYSEYPVVFSSSLPHPSSPFFFSSLLVVISQPLQRDGFNTTAQSSAHVQLRQYCGYFLLCI